VSDPEQSAPPANPFGVLLAVQDLDTAITQHEHRKATVPERREFDELRGRGAALQRQAAEVGAQRDELATRLGHLEEQTAAVVARRKALEDRLYGARGAAGRDLAAIEAEVTHLAVRLGELEDEELALLEEQEPVEQAFERIAAEQAEVAGLSGQVAARVAEAAAGIDEDLARLRGARAEKASLVPEALARRYEDLRSRLGGIGAARLVDQRCDGCHLTLPAVELDRIQHLPPDAVVTCDQCGRILVRPSLVEG